MDGITIKDILAQLDANAPFALAESWDNVGLLVGDPEREVRKILVGLDPSCRLIDEAVATGADTVITHHPVIFHPLKSINCGEPEGRLLATALARGISIIGCHTNLDSARMGVSDVLAGRLGLEGVRPLVAGNTEDGTGLGRIGSYPSPLDREKFLERILDGLGLDTVQVAGRIPEAVATVAVCGGSGSDFAEAAWRAGVDVYLSAEIKHATAIWALERNFCIIDGTHYATEYPAVSLLVEQLRQWLKTIGQPVSVRQAESERHPFSSMGRNRQ